MPDRLTLQEAKELSPGDILLHEGKRWKVNGRVQRWKRDPDRIRVPLKHGLYSYDYLDNSSFDKEGVSIYDLTKEGRF